tara:strand:- start:9626 stop:9952 length:327 start_codon:yes stop_codon:yes gene_type:complete
VICSVSCEAALVVVVNDQSALLSVGVKIASECAIPPLEALVTVILEPSQVFIADPYFSVTIDLVMVCVVFSVLLLEPVVQEGTPLAYTGLNKNKDINNSFFILNLLNQ